MTSASADALSRVSLFAGLAASELDELAAAAGEHHFEAGSVLTRQGERGARVVAFFLLLEGQARVVVDGRTLATLGPHDHAGEIALLRSTPRTATVIAETDLRCLTLSSWAFRSFVEAHPPVAWRLLETMAERLAEQETLASTESSDVKVRRRRPRG